MLWPSGAMAFSSEARLLLMPRVPKRLRLRLARFTPSASRLRRRPIFVGRIEAINRVEVRARVKGYLEAVLFKEGDLVKEGQPLYRIEKGLFEAAVEQAAGALERAKAVLTLAELQRKRAEELLAKAAGTVVARDQAVAEENQAKGAVMAAEADLRTAKINLGYTDIVSPIAVRSAAPISPKATWSVRRAGR